MTSQTASAANAPRGLAARVVGVLTSPRATYAEVVARPHWLGVMAALLVVAVAAVVTFLSTEVGRQAALDQQVRTMESFGLQVTDVAYERLQRASGRAAIFGGLGQAFGLLVGTLVVSGIALAVVNAVLGAGATFKQALAVVVHSWTVLALQSLFILPLDYARETLASPTTLAVFLPVLDESTLAARLLGSIDLFVMWWLVNLAIGLSVLAKHRTGPIAGALLGVYGAIGVTIALVRSALAGT